MKDIYSMTLKELEEEKERYRNFIREINRLIHKRTKKPSPVECGSDKGTGS